MNDKFIPDGPIEYLIFRLQGRWELSDEVIKKISDGLYKAKDPDANLLAIQASELTDDQLDLLVDHFPENVLIHLDDISV